MIQYAKNVVGDTWGSIFIDGVYVNAGLLWRVANLAENCAPCWVQRFVFKNSVDGIRLHWTKSR